MAGLTLFPLIRDTQYASRNTNYLVAACAAASLAIGTLNGEQET